MPLEEALLEALPTLPLLSLLLPSEFPPEPSEALLLVLPTELPLVSEAVLPVEALLAEFPLVFEALLPVGALLAEFPLLADELPSNGSSRPLGAEPLHATSESIAKTIPISTSE
jgi:hypothetical protein